MERSRRWFSSLDRVRLPTDLVFVLFDLDAHPLLLLRHQLHREAAQRSPLDVQVLQHTTHNYKGAKSQVLLNNLTILLCYKMQNISNTCIFANYLTNAF